MERDVRVNMSSIQQMPVLDYILFAVVCLILLGGHTVIATLLSTY